MLEPVNKGPSAEHGRDVLPALIMVVDENLGIQELNSAARDFLGPDQEPVLSRRSGEVFGCAHSEEAAGCGGGRFCQICPIRDAATLACKEQQVVRRRTRAETGGPGQTRTVHLLVTATPLPSPGPGRVLLVLEDISGLVELQDPTPICAYCSRVRQDKHYWKQLESHLKQHFDLELSHGICPECKKLLYGSLMDSAPARSPKRPKRSAKR
jgi:PAS domain-containing protein